MIENILKVEGVKAKGYGIIPKLVMQDKRLTRDAKAIYSYFCSFAGAGNVSFPSVKKICEDLGFGSEDTFRKHFKLLVQYDYLKVEQERNEKGLFARNIYTLVDHPDPEAKEMENEGVKIETPSPKKQGTDEKIPSPKNWGTDTEAPSPKFTGTVNHGHRRIGGIKTTDLKSLKLTDVFKNNNNIKGKKDAVVSDKKTSGKSRSLEGALADSLKSIECIYHVYEITDEETIAAISRAYTSNTEGALLDQFTKALEYIKAVEPQEGYRNIAGAIIKAKDYNIPNQPERKVKVPKKWKTRFHLSESRFEKYSREELEEAVLNKNPTEVVSKEKEKEILGKLKNL